MESGAFAVNLQLLAVGRKITALEVPDVVTDPGMSLVLGRGGISSFLGGDDSRKNWHWLSILVDFNVSFMMLCYEQNGGNKMAFFSAGFPWISSELSSWKSCFQKVL